jgi:S-adenosylmethionine:tRNA ribosyltransferase-isomerase
MANTKQINIKDYSYELPEHRIAKHPLPKRDASKLLIYKEGKITETVFKNLHEHLPSGSLLVFNNTKVIHARLLFNRCSGAQIEIFCIEPVDHPEYQLAFAAKKRCVWKCMVGNAKRWKNETLSKIIDVNGNACTLQATLDKRIDDTFIITFEWDNDNLFFGEVLHHAGILPLPPYLNRDTEISDEERYQTIYASCQGSVAAPTAGLHFTDRVFNNLDAKQIDRAEVTLHVGAGTFKPVKSDTIEHHQMHEELIEVHVQTIQKLALILAASKPIVVVGTTGLRTLESLYWHSVRLMNKHTDARMHIPQWYPYEYAENIPSAAYAMKYLADYMIQNNLVTVQGSTQIIIAPGYHIKMAYALITNFHQPENTLMLLVAAAVGNNWRNIYDYALAHDYRFLSYGDSSLLFINNSKP